MTVEVGARASGTILSVRKPAASIFRNTVGSTLSSTAGSRFPCWQFPDGADSQANAIVSDDEFIAYGWTTMSLAFEHSNPNAGTGNIELAVTSSAVLADGDLSAGDTTIFDGVIAAGAQHLLKRSTIAASITLVAGALRHIRVLRDGDDVVVDTLSGNWNLLELLFTKVT